MKRTERVESQSYNRVIGRSCDICGAELPATSGFIGDMHMLFPYNHKTEELRCKTASFDCCPDCFEDKIIPMMSGVEFK